MIRLGLVITLIVAGCAFTPAHEPRACADLWNAAELATDGLVGSLALVSADVDDIGKGCGVRLFDADDACLRWLVVPLDGNWQGPTPCSVRDTPYSTSDTTAVFEVLEANQLGGTVPDRHRTFD